MTALETQARTLLDRAGVAPGSRTLVACSGGPDSTVLAHLAAAWATAGRLGPVTLVYIDHGLRGELAAEAARIRALAQQLGRCAPVDARVEYVHVDRRRASLEGAARAARYARLHAVAEAWAAPVVLLGHTADDQAETVLMRVIRGSGVLGLGGIPLRRGRYVRPLLETRRAEIEAYLERRGDRPVCDPMNRDRRFLRARVRHELLPQLRRENPRVVEALTRLAQAAREQSEVLDFAADCLLDQARGEGPISFAAAGLASAPPAVAKRAIQRALTSLTPREISGAHLEAVVALAASPPGGSRCLDLPGLRVTREYGEVRLEAAGAAPAPEPAVQISGPDGPYLIRRWQFGDRMRPERLKGRSRKLSDLFGDEKIPRRLRHRARIGVRQSDNEIVWAEYVGKAFGSAIEVRLTGADPVASNKC